MAAGNLGGIGGNGGGADGQRKAHFFIFAAMCLQWLNTADTTKSQRLRCNRNVTCIAGYILL